MKTRPPRGATVSATRTANGTVVLLGPQEATPDAGAALAELGIRGRIALVRAG